MHSMIGMPISVQGLANNMDFVKKSKDEAKEYNWLYHCTSMEALLSIITHREIWLSNLKVVNDKEESKRIGCKGFERSYYVACFTYDPNITEEHWTEYGKADNSALFGVKREWFEKKMWFLNEDHTRNECECFRIFENYNKALEYQKQMTQKKRRVEAPYHIMDYGFYKIIYDDDLKKSMASNAAITINGRNVGGTAIYPSLAGIVKTKRGKCSRNGREYDKDWTSEKEVRLKTCITRNNGQIADNFFFRQIAVQLSDDAFSELPIKFYPGTSQENKARNMNRIRTLLPNTEIYEI